MLYYLSISLKLDKKLDMCFGIISLDLISLLMLFSIKYIISEESSFGPTFLINVYKFGRVEAEVSKLLEKLPLKQAEGL